jgi:hypothetical protein
LQYDSILQSQNTELNKLFATNAYFATQRMERSTERMELMTKSMNDIAKTTERDTASMHIITFFTLVFLPGTFLGVRLLLLCVGGTPHAPLTQTQSFFSTPILSGPAVDGQSGWAFNSGLFLLFIWICLPLMISTILVWAGYMWVNHRRRKRQEQRDHLPVSTHDDSIV